MKRLSDFSSLPKPVTTPGYNPDQQGVGIVHLGIGAFHRGHMAVYTDDVMTSEGGDWRIIGVSLRNTNVRDNLAPQNGLYTLVERGERGEFCRIIGSVKKVLVAPEDPAEVLKHLTAPATRIVSMTITEKGYLRDPASGALIYDHTDIQHDLGNPDKPRTMHGFIVEAFDQIRKNGHPPFTPLCCDNLPANGASLKRVIMEFAALRDEDLAVWIKSHVVFPNTMVDRIVPATTPADVEAVSRILGYIDQAPVLCEPFSQWVIEETLPEPRPAWEKIGVTFVKKVEPYEEMKLRLLNGSHSALAYLGYLGGFEYIHQVIADPDYRTFINTMMRNEVIPTLEMPDDVDLNEYCDNLIERFSNSTLWHRTWQIAMDGSLKIPQRLLNTIRDRIADGSPYPCLAIGLAGWLRYITGKDEKGNAIDVSDPFAKRLRHIADKNQESIPDYVDAVLQVREIFGTNLPGNRDFRNILCRALECLYEKGARKAVL